MLNIYFCGKSGCFRNYISEISAIEKGLSFQTVLLTLLFEYELSMRYVFTFYSCFCFYSSFRCFYTIYTNHPSQEIVPVVLIIPVIAVLPVPVPVKIIVPVLNHWFILLNHFILYLLLSKGLNASFIIQDLFLKVSHFLFLLRFSQ